MVTYSFLSCFICIPAVEAVTSFHSVLDYFHGLMNSINWPALSVWSVWVFIAQLIEHCSANVEAMGSNPVEATENFFSG